MSQLSDIRAIFARHLLLNARNGGLPNANFYADFENEIYILGNMPSDLYADQIAWENVPLDPVPDSWLRFTFFQDSIDQAEYGRYGRNQRSGTVQISVFEPLYIGIGKALDRAGEIEQLFPRGFSDSYNGVTARVMRTEVEHQLSDDRYFHIPVSIYWIAYTAPL